MVDKNLIKVAKRIEFISAIGVGLAILFKIFQIPFSGPLTVMFVPTLALAYTYGGFILLKNNSSNTENMVLLIVTGIALGIGLIGITFKLMYWPNVINMLLVSAFALSVVIVIAIWLKFNSKNSVPGDYNGYLLRTLIVYAFVIFLYLTPKSELIAFQYRGDEEMIRLKTQSYEHPENKEYKKQLEDYVRFKRASANSNDSIK